RHHDRGARHLPGLPGAPRGRLVDRVGSALRCRPAEDPHRFALHRGRPRRLGRVLDPEVGGLRVASSTADSATVRGGSKGPVSGRSSRRRPFTGRTALLIAAFLAPAFLFVAVFTYFPMLRGSQMAFRQWNLYDLTSTPWVGLQNFATILGNAAFPRILLNTVLWVVCSIIPQVVIGFTIARWLRKAFRFRGLYQAFVFYPWAVSGFLIGLLFRWMFNSEFGVINDLLTRVGLIDAPVPWLSDPELAMVAVIVANIWYGVTFFAMMILAALQSVPDELLEAASIDGAGRARMLFS